MQNFLAGMAATVCVFAALVIGYLVGGGEFGRDDGETERSQPSRTQSSSQPQVQPTVLNLRPTSTPQPEAQDSPAPTAEANVAALPDRTDCQEISGTEFRSDSERNFFLANCSAGQAGGGGGGQSSANQPTEPAQPVQNRFTWGGSGGEYIAFSTSLCASGTVGYTVSGEYEGRSFCTGERVPGMPPFTCPEGARAEVQEATAGGATIGEVFCIIPTPQ